jgi:hypothetical protein
MLYGFGDDVAPLPETLELVEDVVLDYATTLLHKVGRPGRCAAMRWGGGSGAGGWEVQVSSAL